MPICGRLPALAALVLVLAAGPALAEWNYLAPGAGDQNVHRAFAFAEESDDRLEFACNSDRRDFFYTTAQTVSEPELAKLKAGKPTLLVRLEGVGVVPLEADDAYQKGGRLIFVSAVSPAFIKDFAKAKKPFAAGMQAAGNVVRQGEFPSQDLQAAMQGLANGCGF